MDIDLDGRIGRRILARIFQDLDERAPEKVAVTVDGGVGGPAEDVTSGIFVTAAGDGGFDDFGHRDRLAIELNLARFQFCEFDGFADGALEMLGFLVDDGEQFAADFFGTWRQIDQARDAGSDGGEGCFQIVGEAIEERGLELLITAGDFGGGGAIESGGALVIDGEQIGDGIDERRR